MKPHQILAWASDISQYDSDAATHIAKACVHLVKSVQMYELSAGQLSAVWCEVDELMALAEQLVIPLVDEELMMY